MAISIGGLRMTKESISLVLTAITSLLALFATIAAWRSARASKVAIEAQFLSNQMEEYGAEKMLYALRTLRNWKADKGDEFERKWRQAIEANDSAAHEVDRARRTVKFYFYKALRLYQSGYVSKRFLKDVCAVDEINILYDIVEPLEYALNPRYDKNNFDSLRKICGRHGIGGLIRPVPVPSIQEDKEGKKTDE
jgi:hypothetical protein